jgi:hypothetical protein
MDCQQIYNAPCSVIVYRQHKTHFPRQGVFLFASSLSSLRADLAVKWQAIIVHPLFYIASVTGFRTLLFPSTTMKSIHH